jgi:uncharacterized protein YaeQ
MALTATIYNFDVQLADVDRGVYETLSFYTHRDPARLVSQLSGEKIHRSAELELYGIDRSLIDGLVARLDRRNSWELSVTDRHVYVAVQGDTVEGDIVRHAIG